MLIDTKRTVPARNAPRRVAAMPIDSKQLGLAIKELRELRQITQRELAEELGITVNFLSLVENGKRGLSVPNLNSLAGALGVPASFITFLGTKCSNPKGNVRHLFAQIQDLVRRAVAADTSLQQSQS